MLKDKRKEIDLIHEGKNIKIGFDIFSFRKGGSNVYKPYMTEMPNFTALFLSISDQNYEKATELYNNKICKLAVDKGEYYELDEENEYLMFDFMEATFVSVVFACAAVESLINNLIPNNILIVRSKSGASREFKFKDFIQKHLTVEEKIKKVLPSIYDYGFNANALKCWINFKILLNYRNEIMHFKSHSFTIHNKNKQTKFVFDLFYHVVSDDVIESARNLIKYLYKKLPRVPGFPMEVIESDLPLDSYISHYRLPDLIKSKQLVIEFPNKGALDEFLSQRDTINNRAFKFYLR